jgi:stage IV sporulation protein FB
MRMNYARATRIAAGTGQLLAFVFGFVGLLYNPLLIFIALFIYIGAAQESAATQMREAARGMTIGDAMVTDFRTLPGSATLNDAVELLLRTSQHEFPVVADEVAGDGGAAADGQVQGLLTREDMIAALRERGPGAPVADVMHRDVARMPWHVGLDGAMQRINETGCPVVLVTDASGRLIGMLTSENLGELMLVQAAMPRGNGGAGAGGRPMIPPPRREALA